MRRDLAICREHDGAAQGQKVAAVEEPQMFDSLVSPASVQEQIEPEQTDTTMGGADDPLADLAMALGDSRTTHKPATADGLQTDVVMSDPPPPTNTAAEKDVASPQTQSQPQVQAESQGQSENPVQIGSPAQAENHHLHTDARPSSANATPKDNSTTLQINTNAPQDASGNDDGDAEDKAPDTGKDSNTGGDLDSLFNDTGGDTNEFSFDQSNTNGLNFGEFGDNFHADNADNDNISSLLPGLEDYANTQSNTGGVDMDMNSFLNAGGDEDRNLGMNQQGAGEQRDTTFDDLMDLANFDGGGMEGEENTNNPTVLDFDSLFN